MIVRSYKLKDEKYLSKNNLIPIVILKIQEIFKLKMTDPNSTIDVIYNHFKNAVVKMNLKNNLTFIDLFMNNSIEKISGDSKNIDSKDNKSSGDPLKNINNISHLAFDYYILKKGDSKSHILFS